MKAKFIKEDLNSVLKPKSKEDILNDLDNASEEMKKEFIINSGTEKFFDVLKWMNDEVLMKILMKVIRQYHSRITSDLIDRTIDDINNDNKEDWDETMKEILDAMNEYDINSMLHYMLKS